MERSASHSASCRVGASPHPRGSGSLLHIIYLPSWLIRLSILEHRNLDHRLFSIPAKQPLPRVPLSIHGMVSEILGGGGGTRPPSSIKQSILADLRWQVPDVGCVMSGERTGTCRLVVPGAQSSGGTTDGCAHPGERQALQEGRRLGRSTMIFMISKTRIPGDHSMDPLAFSVVHQSHVSPRYIPITSPSSHFQVFSCLPCQVHVHVHVFEFQSRSIIPFFSHMSCPSRAGISFTPGLIPTAPPSSAEMPHRTLCTRLPSIIASPNLPSPPPPRYGFRLVSISSHDLPSQQLEVAVY